MRRCFLFICTLTVLLGGIASPSAQKGGLSLNPSQSLYSSLMVYWTLDEASGDRLATWQRATGLTLVDNNTVTQDTGVIGKAALFTAANSEKLTLADNASLSMGDFDFTLAIWVYLGNQTADRRVYHKGRGLAPSEFAYSLRYAFSTGFVRFAVSDGSSAAGVNSAASISGSTWYFVVCQYDATGNTMGISTNASSFATTAWTTGSYDDADPLVMGFDTSATYYDGRMDAFMIWKRLLTTAEIAYLYNGGSGRAPL